MSTTTYDVRTDGRRQLRAAELEPGNEVHFEGQRALVARVVPSGEDVMVELWTRGDFEHRVHFLPLGELVETAVGQ